MRILLWRTRGLGVKVVKSNQDYDVITTDTGIIVDSSQKERIGSKGAKTPRIMGKAGTGTIIPPFQPVLLMLWKPGQREVWFTHETLMGTLSPGANIKVELAPTEKDFVHYIFAMTFGDLVDSDVKIVHSHIDMMKEHEDPLIFSIVNTVYPLNLRVTQEKPHVCTLVNNATADRYVEATFWVIEATPLGAKALDDFIEKFIAYYSK